MSQGLLGKIAEQSGGASSAKKADGNGTSAPAKGLTSALAGETVKLTSSAKLLERLEKSFASLPEIDRSRVDAVRNAIENGDYEVDADKLAAAVLYSDALLERS